MPKLKKKYNTILREQIGFSSEIYAFEDFDQYFDSLSKWADLDSGLSLSDLTAY